MKVRNISTKLTAVLFAMAAPIALGSFRGPSKTSAFADQVSANFAPFTLGANQTAQLIVTTPASGGWGDSSKGLVMLGFDVFRPSDVTSSQQPGESCSKHHMIETRACQVTVSPGEAASWHVDGDGVSTFRPVVMLGSGSVKELRITLEVTEAGRVVALVPLPAVQKGG